MNCIQNLYETGKITADEMSKLSEVRERFLVALEKDAGAIVEFVKEEFEDCNEEELDKLSEMVDGLERNLFEQSDPDEYVMAGILADCGVFSKLGQDREKLATLTSTLKGVFGRLPVVGKLVDVTGEEAMKAMGGTALLGGLGLTLLGSLAQGINLIKHPIQEAMDRANTKRESEATLASILRGSPELKGDAQTIKNFSVLQRYAPQTVATNQPLAETMLKKMQQWGGVDPQSLQQMISMEHQHAESLKSKSFIPETSMKPMVPSFDKIRL